MKVRDIFKKAVAKVYADGELDKIINNPNPALGQVQRVIEVREAKKLKACLDKVKQQGDKIEDLPLVPLMYNINSSEVFRDIIFYMIRENYKGVENEK